MTERPLLRTNTHMGWEKEGLLTRLLPAWGAASYTGRGRPQNPGPLSDSGDLAEHGSLFQGDSTGGSRREGGASASRGPTSKGHWPLVPPGKGRCSSTASCPSGPAGLELSEQVCCSDPWVVDTASSHSLAVCPSRWVQLCCGDGALTAGPGWAGTLDASWGSLDPSSVAVTLEPRPAWPQETPRIGGLWL